MQAQPEALPCRPGTSPFHVRGLTWINLIEHADRHAPGGFAAVRARVADPELAAFLSQVFLAVGWYDVLPVRPVTEAIAAVEGRPLRESVLARARYVADRDTSTFFRLLLKAAPPGLVVERLPKLALRYFDFGETAVAATDARTREVTFRGLPAFTVPWFTPLIEGYVTRLLELAGGRSPSAHTIATDPDGARGGLATATVRFRVGWL